MIQLSEDDVKKGVLGYLQYAMNQGKLWFSRLNAGDIFIKNKDGSYRSFKGAGKGTADFIVIQGGNVQKYYKAIAKGTPCSVAFVTFVECKSSKGKQRLEQVEFEEQVIKLNCRYRIVRSVDELMEVLER